MQLRHIDIHPLLKGYVEKIWVFESSGRVPSDDMKLIVPNGLIKIVIPFKNRLFGRMEGWSHLSHEHELTLIGICDIPSIVDAEKDICSGTIGVEFSPMGAYRFFSLRQSEIKNQIHKLSDVLGKTAKDIEEVIALTTNIDKKIKILQQFLYRLSIKNQVDDIFEYCVNKIQLSKGGVTIKQLEKETGYSARWLNLKFDEKVGISPKNLCAITRFQYYYHALAQDAKSVFIERDFRALYYDQSHFIKEFKRFTGLAPTKFENSMNDFGKIFYKE